LFLLLVGKGRDFRLVVLSFFAGVIGWARKLQRSPEAFCLGVPFLSFRAMADLHKAKQMLDEKDAEISKQRQELENLTTNKGNVHGSRGRTHLYMSLSGPDVKL
jgi:hypothetical protein